MAAICWDDESSPATRDGHAPRFLPLEIWRRSIKFISFHSQATSLVIFFNFKNSKCSGRNFVTFTRYDYVFLCGKDILEFALFITIPMTTDDHMAFIGVPSMTRLKATYPFSLSTLKKYDQTWTPLAIHMLPYTCMNTKSHLLVSNCDHTILLFRWYDYPISFHKMGKATISKKVE